VRSLPAVSDSPDTSGFDPGGRSKGAVHIERLDISKLPAAVDLFAVSFYSDPLMEFVVPNPGKRLSRVRWLEECILRYCLRYGRVDATAKMTGAIAWLPPGATHMHPLGTLRAGLWATPFMMGWSALRRLRAYAQVKSTLHRHYAPYDHWYLLDMAVNPVSQGQGIGGALIEPVLNEADAEGLVCYLETLNPRSRQFFERYGFRAMPKATIKDGPDVWAMLRSPR